MKRILIVEDDFLTAENISEDLESRGYQTNVAHSPNEAQSSIKNKIPDLILMDIHLNDSMDGVELAQKINEHNNIPVIYLTDDQDDRLFEKIRRQHTSHFLNKPFRAALLAHTIDLVLGGENPETSNNPDFLFVKVKTSDGRKQRVLCRDICYIRADRSYCKLYVLQDGKDTVKMLHLSNNMAQIFKHLPSNDFLQVHRSFVVNIGHIKEFDAKDLYLPGGTSIPLGESYKAEFLQRIRQV